MCISILYLDILVILEIILRLVVFLKLGTIYDTLGENPLVLFKILKASWCHCIT